MFTAVTLILGYEYNMWISICETFHSITVCYTVVLQIILSRFEFVKFTFDWILKENLNFRWNNIVKFADLYEEEDTWVYVLNDIALIASLKHFQNWIHISKYQAGFQFSSLFSKSENNLFNWLNFKMNRENFKISVLKN